MYVLAFSSLVVFQSISDSALGEDLVLDSDEIYMMITEKEKIEMPVSYFFLKEE